MLVSVVIRTLNEEQYLEELMAKISAQEMGDIPVEVIVVDSGSSDETLNIAESAGARITHIKKTEFSFGRSLNQGCDFANGDILVFISGHCVPTENNWLALLIEPLIVGSAGYVYGRQLGRDTTKFSERQLFNKYFSSKSYVSNKKFFCNNANAAVSRDVWSRFGFNEELTGLEDMDLAKRIVATGGSIAYVSNASVFHIHNETWRQTKRRYEREALALRFIMPEVHVKLVDVLRYVSSAIFLDCIVAKRERVLLKEFVSIIKFRFAQYFGTYEGNRPHRKISTKMKDAYFYPSDKESK